MFIDDTTVLIMASFLVMVFEWGYLLVEVLDCVVVSAAVLFSVMDVCTAILSISRGLITGPVVRCLVLVAVSFSLAMMLGSEESMVFTAVGQGVFLFSVMAIVGTFLCQGLEICVGKVMAIGVVESLQDSTFVEVHWLDVFLVIVGVVKLSMSFVFGMILAINMLWCFVVNYRLFDMRFSMSILMEKLVMRGSAMIIDLTFFHGVKGCLMDTSFMVLFGSFLLFVEIFILQVNNGGHVCVVGLLSAVQV